MLIKKIYLETHWVDNGFSLPSFNLVLNLLIWLLSKNKSNGGRSGAKVGHSINGLYLLK